MWSARLAKTLTGLGHEPALRAKPVAEAAEVAIVNLGDRRFGPEVLVPELRAMGVHVIGHAGHKELELHELGKQIGCDTLATNRELTYSLERLLKAVTFAPPSSQISKSVGE